MGEGAGPAPSIDDFQALAPADPSDELATLIWPHGRLPDDRADWFCRMYSRLAVTNRSLVHFVIRASVEEGIVVLRGATNAPSVVRGLTRALRSLGVEQIRQEVRTLPDRDRLGGKLFGACRLPQALTFSRPGEDGDVQTELLFGEPVFLLDREAGFYLLHAGDGYWGWVREEAIAPLAAERFAEYTSHRRGALLADGGQLDIPPGLLQLESSDPASAASERVKAALDLLYAPYVFGGRSALGLDCSGLMTNMGSRTGEFIARDVWQQAFAGTLTATRWHRGGIRPGDLLFFINASGKMYHTGVAISPTHVVHATPPCVQIGSLNPGDRLYDARLDRDFFMAKRH